MDILLALGIVGVFTGASGLLLGYAAVRLRPQGDPVVEQIEALLPQTQCAQCGFAGCRPYAEAVASGLAAINRCPPGGAATIKALARLLGRDAVALDSGFGEHKPQALAHIDEQVCIGCVLCIKACPVDAILGANRRMHTVITSECTGCELCLTPCPVDCITMVPVTSHRYAVGSRAAGPGAHKYLSRASVSTGQM
jgi:electron transport complex protein RnfB